MGFMVVCGEKTAWNTGILAGKLFSENILLLENTFSVESGIKQIIEDQIDIDEGKFRWFFDNLFKKLETISNYNVYFQILPTITICFVLYKRVFCQFPQVPAIFSGTILESIPMYAARSESNMAH